MAMALYTAPNEDVIPDPRQPKIREVRAYVSRSEDDRMRCFGPFSVRGFGLR